MAAKKNPPTDQGRDSSGRFKSKDGQQLPRWDGWQETVVEVKQFQSTHMKAQHRADRRADREDARLLAESRRG